MHWPVFSAMGESTAVMATRLADRAPAGDGVEAAAIGRLSVAIITKNAAQHLQACLASVAFADQIVVVDSGSTDETVRIAREAGAEVVETDWPGFGPQKNRALALCRHPWVLSLDADECLSDELAAAVRARVAGSDGVGEGGDGGDGSEPGGTKHDRAGERSTAAGTAPVGYWMRRHSAFCGQVMRHGLWGNDRVLRLFRRDRARFTDDLVHERVTVDGATATLDGSLLHDSVDTVGDAMAKARFYAELGARGLRERGRRAGPVAAIGHASWTFVRGYLMKAGFLDGRNGLVLAYISALGTYWKYRWSRSDVRSG